MEKFQTSVAKFMLLAGQDIPQKPKIPSKEIQDLRIKLIQEELDELKQNSSDFVNVADAIADLLYVVIGTAVAYGLDIEPIFEEVHSSNMTKFIDGYRREDGKWIKGKSYKPADIKSQINKQL